MVVKKRPTFYILISSWLIILIIIGVWWLYLIVSLGKKLELANKHLPEIIATPNLASIVLWEGLTFFTLIILTFIFLFLLFLKDRKKTANLQTFFSSMTHELKTPLASMKLQAEVIGNKIQMKKYDETAQLIKRLEEDSNNLEFELDKSLQLARVLNGGNINLEKINIFTTTSNIVKKYPFIHFETNDKTANALADKFSYEIILKNIIQNSIVHSDMNLNELTLNIKLFCNSEHVTITFQNNGSKFKGDIKKLGSLFYKHKSPNGSGVGLYLTKKLLQNMNGSIKFYQENKFTIEINLRRA